MNILVIGAGLVGGVIARDLSQTEGFSVVAADISENALSHLQTRANLDVRLLRKGSQKEIGLLCQEFDFVVNAVPGDYGYGVCEALLESGAKVVDIAFFSQDPRPLDDIGRRTGGLVVPDCGVAPGLSNLMVGYSASVLDSIQSVRILVGGLPQVRVKPFEYKAVFSPRDVIEEYLRPARLKENGREVVRDALTGCEAIEIASIGTLEAFNTDGLRSLLWTIDAPEMVEKTIRYPGYCEKLVFLKEIGLFSSKPVMKSSSLTPLDVTSALLIDQWKLRPGDKDLTVMQVEVVGLRAHETVRISFDLFDRYDESREETSMSRTTGFTASAMISALSQGLVKGSGILYPEQLASQGGLFEYIRRELERRSVTFTLAEECA